MGLRKTIRRLAKNTIISRTAFSRYVKTNSLKRLHLGAGDNCIEGWLNTDIKSKHENIYHLDVRKKFPFKDGTFNYIYSEHLIEHLNYEEGSRMLREYYRVLMDGGYIRIATPDLRKLIHIGDPSEDRVRYVVYIMNHFLKATDISEDAKEAFVINTCFYGHGHKFIYDYETLKCLLEQAGFRNIRRYEYGESEDPNLQGIERHGANTGSIEACKYETIAVEAMK